MKRKVSPFNNKFVEIESHGSLTTHSNNMDGMEEEGEGEEVSEQERKCNL